MTEPDQPSEREAAHKTALRRAARASGASRRRSTLLLLGAFAAALFILLWLWPYQPSASKLEKTPLPEQTTYYAAAAHPTSPKLSLASAVR